MRPFFNTGVQLSLSSRFIRVIGKIPKVLIEPGGVFVFRRNLPVFNFFSIQVLPVIGHSLKK